MVMTDKDEVVSSNLTRPTVFFRINISKVTILFQERFPYKEEVTGSNPVAPTRVFQKSTLLKIKKPTKDPHFL